MRTGKLLNQDWKRFNEATTQLSKAKLYIDDTPGITIGEIRAKCRRLASSSDGLRFGNYRLLTINFWWKELWK